MNFFMIGGIFLYFTPVLGKLNLDSTLDYVSKKCRFIIGGFLLVFLTERFLSFFKDQPFEPDCYQFSLPPIRLH